MSVKEKYLLLFILIAVSINYFNPTHLPPLFKLSRYVILIAFIILSFNFINLVKGGVAFPIKLIIIGISFSILMSIGVWGQSPTGSIIATVPFLSWSFFFFFYKLRLSIALIEKCILTFGIIYCSIFFFQFSFNDSVYFGLQDEFIEDRGITRVIIPSGNIFVLASFIALNKMTEQKENIVFYFVIMLLGIIVPMLQVTRQAILLIFLIYLFHFIKRKSLTYKSVLILLFSGFSWFVWNSDLNIIEGLKNVQYETNREGLENIRVKAAFYFLNDFSPNGAAKVLGNGVPYSPGKSDYGDFVQLLTLTEGYYLSDIGIVSVIVIFGLLAFLGYIIIWIKAFLIRLPPQYSYLQYYQFYLLGTAFTSDTTYSQYAIITTVLVLYCYQILYESQRNSDSNIY